MLKRSLMVVGLLLTTIPLFAQSPAWKPVAGKIMTPWAEQVDPGRVLPEYPRPQLVRATWLNLNGLWEYALTPNTPGTPTFSGGKILVPFAVESALSGVGKTVGKDSVLWYRRTVTLPAAFKGRNVRLHFGAVDWQCDVTVNGQSVGTHRGGYDPFSFDITPFLKKSGPQEVVVRVWDPTSDGPQPRGKQINNPNSIWYTPVTGIWQTVWLEALPATYILSTRQTPDIDKRTLTVTTQLQNRQPGDRLRLTALDGGQTVAQTETDGTGEAVLTLNAPKLWSPESPFLYDLRVAVVRNGKVIDEATSYFAMRKISVGTDAAGIRRMLLNNRFVFQYGPLDQGWWPDGLYTAPTDEALRFDIDKTREMGFNMIRKHVKVEPARWYYHCDKLGMLVWQDMPSGDLGNRWNPHPGVTGLETERDRTPESEAIFRTEWKAILDATYNFPSIVVWVPFNEAWGQFKTGDITRWTKAYDPSRLVNSASGGNFYNVGDMIDLHHYPDPAMPSPELFGDKQVLVLGEFGGLGLPVEGHTWQDKNNWGYQSFKNEEELFQRYAAFMDRFDGLIRRGLSAAVYTQTTDVEIETNGLMTYDRKVIKLPAARIKPLHDKLYDPSRVTLK